jgi:phenylalanyl-tRNA synthetase beta chain
MGIEPTGYVIPECKEFDMAMSIKYNNDPLAMIGQLSKPVLQKFDIKQPVFYAGLSWDKLIALTGKNKMEFKEIPKFPAVQRDLSMIVDKSITWDSIEKTALAARINKLKNIHLFDVFISDKLGEGKKSVAINFTFQDDENTLTDKETDAMMGKIISCYEKGLNAEVRK